MRTAIGLFALGIVGGVVPVGFSAMPYLTPLLTGTFAAFLILLTLCVAASAVRPRHPRRFESTSSRPAAAPPSRVRAAAHRAI
jgi:hypothetical protein